MPNPPSLRNKQGNINIVATSSPPFPKIAAHRETLELFSQTFKSHPSAVGFAAPSSWTLGKKKKKKKTTVSDESPPLPASQRDPGDGSPPAEVVRPPLHRHRGGRGLLPGAALSVAEGRGHAAAGSGHAEVRLTNQSRPTRKTDRREGKIRTIATEMTDDVNPSSLSTSPLHFCGVLSTSQLQLSRSNTHTCAREQNSPVDRCRSGSSSEQVGVLRLGVREKKATCEYCLKSRGEREGQTQPEWSADSGWKLREIKK